jgi:hypothetical protein
MVSDVKRRTERALRHPAHQAEHKAETGSGWYAYLARGVVFRLIGIFVTTAAIEYDPKEAIGFDGALQKTNADSGRHDRHDTRGDGLAGRA